MLEDRIKEIVDFATTQSPYKSANDGWINDDVYLEWGASSNQSLSSRKELADVSVYWKPINEIVLILFLVVAFATILVFTSVSISHGKFSLSLGTAAESLKAAKPAESPIEIVQPVTPPMTMNSIKISKPDLVEEQVQKVPSEDQALSSNNSRSLSSGPMGQPIASGDIKRVTKISYPKKAEGFKTRKLVTADDLFQR